MSLLPGIEQRYLNPQTGPLDTLLPDAGIMAIPSVLVFNIGDVNSITVRCQGGQTINGVATYIVTPRVSVLFVSDGIAWRTHDGARVTNNLSIGARAFRNLVMVVGNAAFTLIPFSGVRYDTDAMWGGLFSGVGLTIRTAGRYEVGGCVEWANAAGAIRILDIRLNGTTFIGRQSVAPIGGGIVTEMSVSTIYNFVAGDFIDLVVFQDSGAPLNINLVGNYSPELWAHRLGDGDSSGVAAARRINTVGPLSGGGSLAADLTLSIAFPGGTTSFLRADGAFAPVANLSLTTVEVSLGSAPSAPRSGHFTIAGVGLTIGKPVFIQQASGSYTGKGTRNDEAEMDQVLVVGKVISAVAIECFWKSQHQVRGNFKFNYSIGA